MKKIFISLAILFLLTLNLSCTFAAEEMNILQKSDNAFFPNEAKFKFRMEDYENNKFKRYYLFNGYIKGSDRYLLVGKEPAIFKGTVQLRVGDIIFYYLKRIDKTNQVSARVAFYSSLLSQEDVMSTKLSNFYNLETYTPKQIDGNNVYMLTLIAKSKEVAYYKIVSYINSNNYLPMKREYYSFSGQKIKEMIIDDLQIMDGKLSSMKFTMYDCLRKELYSKVIISDFEYNKAIPDIFFTKTYMKIVSN